MNAKLWLIAVLALTIGLIGGFFLANSLNRSELNTLRAENEQLKANATKPAGELSDEEIRQKIAEADQKSQDFNFQKDLGIALYRYATLQKRFDLLTDVERILTRANALNPKDFDVLVVLGNTIFDIAYGNKDNEKFARAREIYQTALIQKPEDIDVQTDLALTYFFTNPPDLERSSEELNKSLKKDPNHERTLQFVAQVYIKQNKKAEAEQTLEKIRQINPGNPQIPDLEAQIRQMP